MKNSKSSTKGKKRSSSAEKKQTKRTKAQTKLKSEDKDNKASSTTKTLPRKTRWQDKSVEAVEVVKATNAPTAKEQLPVVVPQRLKNLLDDKERVVEHLFSTLPATTFQEIIPDYLKKYSKDELKKLCLEQIKDMTKDFMLHVISGKDPKLYSNVEKKKDEERSKSTIENRGVENKNIELKKDLVDNENLEKKAAETNHDTRTFTPKIEEKDRSTVTKEGITERSRSPSSLHESDSSSRDILELFATSKEMEDMEEEREKSENENPTENSQVEGDAELLELEMRARAIRSLLRAKNLANTETVE